MRTTVTLEPDTEALLRKEMLRRRLSFKAVLNEAVRRGLERGSRRPRQQPYQVQTFSSGFQPGVDPTKLNQMADHLESEAYLRKSLTQRPSDRS